MLKQSKRDFHMQLNEECSVDPSYYAAELVLLIVRFSERIEVHFEQLGMYDKEVYAASLEEAARLLKCGRLSFDGHDYISI